MLGADWGGVGEANAQRERRTGLRSQKNTVKAWQDSGSQLGQKLGGGKRWRVQVCQVRQGWGRAGGLGFSGGRES